MDMGNEVRVIEVETGPVELGPTEPILAPAVEPEPHPTKADRG